MADDRARWLFVEQNPNDRVRSTARRHALEGSGLQTEARVVREAIQNSVDATLPDAKTDVWIWQQTIAGDQVLEFRRLLGFDDCDSPLARLADLGLPAGNAFERAQCASAGDSPSFRVAIIGDRNTCGLGYDAGDKVDRFEELCLSHGQDTTSVSGARGGSYGFGKSVYEEASDCNTFVVYSVFAPSDQVDEKGSHARLFGCATFDGHERNGAKYTGRALFGVHTQSETGLLECRPVVDDAAHEMAAQLGFVKRDADDLGTSIMILGASFNMVAVREAIEDWWWPRILANRLSIELLDDDEDLPSPEPRQRPELEPYLRCYSLIEEGIPKTTDELVHRFHPVDGAQLGRLALTPRLAPAESEADADADADVDSPFADSVALIRNGPRMVVKYLDPGGRGAGSFAGVFLSDSDADQALHLSEPAAHDDWNPESQRIRDAFPTARDERETAIRIVRAVMERVKRYGRAYRLKLDPPPPPTPVDGARDLQQLLARVMSGRHSGPPRPPPVGNDPFEMQIDERRENDSNVSRVAATVKLGLKPDAPNPTETAVASLRPVRLLDDNRRREKSESVPLASVRVDGEAREPENGFDLPLTLAKDSRVVIEMRSEAFARELYASLDVGLELRDPPAADGTETPP